MTTNVPPSTPSYTPPVTRAMFRRTAIMAGVVTAVAVGVLVVLGFGLGWLGDLATGTFPLLAMVGLALGVALAVVYVVKQFKRYS